ncbi:uncharacterized protein ACA1_031270 [Acanthamoeba castellanii str. Neff]|uniref:Uncharacterized protein n=1 Tax=Acanthamoeba castellanii (strain ATCC 30010 / Neff) TaxID=1257118 RepID=L8GHB8_ACACF|nr:uncharacterized protein ACA1_031270 [Acanthamoeba castellanii str. Neff]ELR12234.1 hypothetical protein ACA1_031270 [Acanthamoeba castellanii str. Neff]
MDYDPGQEAAGGYPRAERLAHREVARGRYEGVRLRHVGQPGALLWISDRNWSDGNDKLWSNGRAPPGCAQLEARLLAKRTHEQVNCGSCVARLCQERREQLGRRLLKKCQNEMMHAHMGPKPERDRQAKRKAAAEESAWEKDDKYANPSLVQMHSPFGQTLQLDQEGSCTFQMMVHCISDHPKSELEVEFVVKSLTGLETYSLPLHHVKAKRGDKEKKAGRNRKRRRLDEEPSAVAAQDSASSSPQDNLILLASQTPTGPPPMGDNLEAGSMHLYQDGSNCPLAHLCREAGHTGSSPFHWGSEVQDPADITPDNAGSPPFISDMTDDSMMGGFSCGSDVPPPTQLSASSGAQVPEAFGHGAMAQPASEAEQPQLYSSALGWFNFEPEGDLLKELSLCTSPSRYSGSSLDLEGSEEDALADSVHGSDSAQVSLTPPPIALFFFSVFLTLSRDECTHPGLSTVIVTSHHFPQPYYCQSATARPVAST